MGKPYEIVHEGQQIKFCCKKCLPKFEKDPAAYLSKLK
jgi:YHS domain-containing protein